MTERASKRDQYKSHQGDKTASRSQFLSWAKMTLSRSDLLFIQALVIIGITIWVFQPTLRATWYGDDDLYLLFNPLLQDPNRIWKAWFEPGSFIEYYPIEQTVQWCQWKLWGSDDTLGYHITNLVLHITSALLLWYFLSKLDLKLAWLGGLIFAIHPMVVDTVSVICELKSTLSLPPFLLAMCFYLDFEKTRKSSFYFLALFFFLVAMLCKITMFFFPVMILIYGCWKRGRVTLRDVKASVPFFVISIILCLTTVHDGAVYAKATHYASPGPIYLGGVLSRFALCGLSLTFYLGRCFLPLHPMPLYPLWKIDPPSALQFLPWLVIILMIYCCWLKRQTWGRHLLLGLAFFALGLAPFLGLNQVSYMCLTWVQDHFLYIPIIGIIALAVTGLEYVGGRLPRHLLPLGIAATTLAVVLLIFASSTYAAIFADPARLWPYNGQYNPNSWAVQCKIGSVLVDEERFLQAIEPLEKSLKINTDCFEVHLGLAVALENVQRHTEAIDQFKQTIAIIPKDPMPHFYLGKVLLEEGRSAEAADQFEQFVQIDPESDLAHDALGVALIKSGHIHEGIAQLETALQINPLNVEARKNLTRAQTTHAKVSPEYQLIPFATGVASGDGDAMAIKTSPYRLILGNLAFGGKEDVVLTRELKITGLPNGTEVTRIDLSHADGIQIADRQNLPNEIVLTLKIDVWQFSTNRPYGSLVKQVIRFETNSQDQPQLVVSVIGWLGSNETSRDFNNFIFSGSKRWQGWWATPNIAGAIIAALMPFFLCCSVWVWSNRNRGIHCVNIGVLLLLLIESCALLFLLAHTYSRGAWIAYAAGSLAMMVFPGLLRKWAAIFLILFFLGLFFLPSGFKRLASYGQMQEDLSIVNRVKLWTGALQMMADHPLTGVGVSQFGAVFERDYQRFDHTAQNSTAVSDYLTWGAERGALTLWVMLGFAVFITWESLRRALNHKNILQMMPTATLISMLVASAFSTLSFIADYQCMIAVCLFGLIVLMARQIYESRKDARQLMAIVSRTLTSFAGTFVVLGALMIASLRILPTRTTELMLSPSVQDPVVLHLVEPRWRKSKGIIIYFSASTEGIGILFHSTLRPLAARGWQVICSPIIPDQAENLIQSIRSTYPKEKLFIAGDGDGGRLAWLTETEPWAKGLSAGAGYGFLSPDLDPTKGKSLPGCPFLIGHYLYDDVVPANTALRVKQQYSEKTSALKVSMTKDAYGRFSKDWMGWLMAVDQFFSIR